MGVRHPTVLLICDQPDWILGKIAYKFSSHLVDFLNIIVLPTVEQGFLKKFKEYQRSADLVHFLSPWDYYKYKNYVQLPCVVTLWHMVDWAVFDPHMDRIDVLCVGSAQWQSRANEHISGTFPIIRMPYGLDTQEFKRNFKARNDYLVKNNWPGDTLVFGFAGAASSNQSDRKGLGRLFKSLLLLKKRLSVPVNLRIIGRGWRVEEIPYELRSNVILDEFIPVQDLPRYYSSLDYYLCLSKTEGVPYPVLEAMSCQALAISTPVGVVPEILKDGENGFILREDNYLEEIINIIEQTAFDLDYRKKCGENARKTVVEKFTWENVMDARIFDEIYMRAIEHFSHRKFFNRLAIKFNALVERN